MRTTRKDVAAKAGVSVATVSYVMNRSKNVTPEVRKRVEKAARELQYRPNLVAKSLVTKRSRHVAILVDDLQNPYYARLLEGAQNLATEENYLVSLILTAGSGRERLMGLVSRQLDGLVAATQCRAVIQRLEELGIPCLGTRNYPMRVRVDYREAVRDMLRALHKLGHERIVCISGTAKEAPDAREEIFREALLAEGLSFCDGQIIHGERESRPTMETGYRAANKLLRSAQDFSAIFAINDLVALGAIQSLREAGYDVPADVSVVGCDNNYVNTFMRPQLASMEVQPDLLGKELMRDLLCVIERKPYEGRIITARFVARDSIGPFVRNIHR